MAVLSSIVLPILLISPLTAAHAPPFECPSSNPLEPDLICTPSSLTPPPFDSAAHYPWTHEPHCLHPAEKPLLDFCVFTDAEFRGGMSVVTLPELGGLIAGRVAGTGVGGAGGEGTRSEGESKTRREDGSENDDESESERWGESENESDSRDETGNESGQAKKYEERLVPGKGRSLFSKTPLKAGETLLTEHPSVLLARDALKLLLPEERHRLNWLGVMQLPDTARQSVRGLSSTARYADEVDGAVAVNALGVQVGGFGHLGVFPETAKVNHDCTPNLYYRFNETTLALNVFALRDISPGEELSYSYLDPLSTPLHKDRHAALSPQWDFTCTCPICADSPLRAASDLRREEIRGVKAQLAESARDPPRIVRLCNKLLGLYEEEGAIVPRGMVAEMAAYASNQAGEVGRAAEFAEIAMRAWGLVAGVGSAEVRRLEELLADPRGHGSYEPGEGLGEETE